MTLADYQQLLERIPFGKRLPTSVYALRGEQCSLGEELDRLVGQVVATFQIGPEFNVIKFRTDELKVSFLCYSRFFENPHPALSRAITIDLVRGRAKQTDYADNPKPASGPVRPG